MKTCLKTGSTERAVGPTGELSVGTSRQPRTRCPSSTMIRLGFTLPAPAALADEEGMRHLDQDAGAVSRIDVAAAGAAVHQVLQHRQGLAYDRVGLSALDVHHEADAAGVVLVGGVVETLRWG